MAISEFTRSLREAVRRGKQEEAESAAKAAQAKGDLVAVAHHEGRARAFYDSWRSPDAQREVDDEVVAQLRDSLGHPDPAVRASARHGLEDFGVHAR